MNVGHVQELIATAVEEAIKKALDKIEDKVHEKVGGLNFDRAFGSFAIYEEKTDPLKIHVYAEEFLQYNCVQYSFDLERCVDEFMENVLEEEKGADKIKKVRDALASLVAKMDKKLTDA